MVDIRPGRHVAGWVEMHVEHVPRRRARRRGVCVVARERDERMVRVRRVDGDPAHEASRRRRRVDAVEDHRTARFIGIRGDEDASAPQPHPKRTGVARRPHRCDDELAGRFVGPEGVVGGQVRPDRHPVTA